MKMEQFISILKKDQPTLKKYLGNKLKSFYGEDCRIDSEKFLYARGKLPVLLVAHLDTVHRQTPKTIARDEQHEILWSPEGIGGDDRCGVYAIISILERLRTDKAQLPHVLFTTDEETGGRGARVAANDLPKPDIRFILEFDRKGYDDAVFYSCDNKKFHKHVAKYGFKKSFGSFSDISILSPAWDIASVNLSCGYYNAHTNAEYIRMKHLHKTIDRAYKMLSDVSDSTPSFDYCAPKVTYTPFYSGSTRSLTDKFNDYDSRNGSLNEFPDRSIYRKSAERYYSGKSMNSSPSPVCMSKQDDLVSLSERTNSFGVERDSIDEIGVIDSEIEEFSGDPFEVLDSLYMNCESCAFENMDYNCAGCDVYSKICLALCDAGSAC